MKRLLKSGITVVAVAGILGLGMGMPPPTVGQIISQVSSQDKEALAEADRLIQQAFELLQQGKYNEAISLAEKGLAIFKKVLQAVSTIWQSFTSLKEDTPKLNPSTNKL